MGTHQLGDRDGEVGDVAFPSARTSAPDATYWITGSSKHSNEQSYLFCKFVSMFGTNNMDHQAHLPLHHHRGRGGEHLGLRRMTNSHNDYAERQGDLFHRSNAAEAHPVSMLHILHAKEGGIKVIVADPRYTRTAA